MKLLFLLFFIPFTLFASKIISYNIYDRTDRVDLMITFDTPYTGVIKQSTHNSKIIIKLSDAQIESSKIKQLSTRFLNSITLTPIGNSTQIVAQVPYGIRFIASKTTDGYGLRLRFTNKPAVKKAPQSQPTTDALLTANLPTKKDSTISTQYYIVVGIMFIAVLILFYIQKRVKKTPEKSPWLFKEKNTEQQGVYSNEVTIRFQKKVDEKNSVVMIDFGEQSYLVLMGEGNILLDKYTENKPSTQEDFNEILKSRRQELDELLQVEKKNDVKFNHIKDEALQSYQQKAASLIYSEEN